MSKRIDERAWRLIVPNNAQPQLFNIAADPYEKTELAQTEPAKLAELQKRLADEHAKDDPKLPEDLKGLPN